MVSLAQFEERFAKLVNYEEEKYALIRRQLKREGDVSDMYQRRVEEIEAALKKKEQDIFVSVLIDGDCMNFLDEHLRGGELGGREAARGLKLSILDYVRHQFPAAPANLQIVIRIYANYVGLAKTYVEAQTVPNVAFFGAFINGFNKEDPLCDFVNAGDGKECADEKIRATFNISISNVHCFRVIFGASADNGYARLLGPHRDSEKITLLEGPPFARELAELATKLPTMSCSSVFRSCKILGNASTLSLTPPRTPAAQITPAVKYAAAAANAAVTPKGSQTIPGAPSRPAVALNRTIARNSASQRVDTPIQCSTGDIKAMKAKKLCNEFHILGTCKFALMGRPCTHSHGKRVSGHELEALRYVARLSRCPQGLACKDVNCICGHRCLKDPCRQGRLCFFPPEMHGVDIKIVSYD
ncbi:hypothetical protein K469DRAFT_723371 [Zopfia rhizophila CBS 207.26]|uniref:C3H1-type domain-containing protein n=1 Tax=Zopfia rhizophila CBS 207.26 TaxID=1314779 RepID=A0A6A6D978_9PEZI|nr:hypothetical protein K469DRAFT_723371 [Zopfia rhizophila CBS 207.26]